MDLLQQLISKCKCSITLSVNEHRDYYQTVEQYFDDFEEELKCIDEETFQKMKETNSVIKLQFYPNTPVGFCVIWHYNLKEALKLALEIF